MKPTFGSTQLTAEAPIEDDGSVLKQGLRSGLYNAGASISALMGTAVDAVPAIAARMTGGAMPTAPSEMGQALYDKARVWRGQGAVEAPEIQSFGQVKDANTFGQYAAGMVGGAAPALGAGLAGAMAARNPLVGASLATTPFTAGDIAMRQQEDPAIAALPADQRFAQAGGAGLSSATAQSIVPVALGGKIIGRGLSQAGMSGTRNVLSNLTSGVGGNAAAGYLGEKIAQNSLTDLNAARDTSMDEDRLFESAVAGGLMGAPFAAGGMAGEAVLGKRPAPRTDGVDLNTGLPAEAAPAKPSISERVSEFVGKRKPKDGEDASPTDGGPDGPKPPSLLERGLKLFTKPDEAVDLETAGKVARGEETVSAKDLGDDPATQGVKLDAADKALSERAINWGRKLLEDQTVTEDVRALANDFLANPKDATKRAAVAAAFEARGLAERTSKTVNEFSQSMAQRMTGKDGATMKDVGDVVKDHATRAKEYTQQGVKEFTDSFSESFKKKYGEAEIAPRVAKAKDTTMRAVQEYGDKLTKAMSDVSLGEHGDAARIFVRDAVKDFGAAVSAKLEQVKVPGQRKVAKDMLDHYVAETVAKAKEQFKSLNESEGAGNVKASIKEFGDKMLTRFNDVTKGSKKSEAFSPKLHAAISEVIAPSLEARLPGVAKNDTQLRAVTTTMRHVMSVMQATGKLDADTVAGLQRWFGDDTADVLTNLHAKLLGDDVPQAGTERVRTRDGQAKDVAATDKQSMATEKYFGAIKNMTHEQTNKKSMEVRIKAVLPEDVRAETTPESMNELMQYMRDYTDGRGMEGMTKTQIEVYEQRIESGLRAKLGDNAFNKLKRIFADDAQARFKAAKEEQVDAAGTKVDGAKVESDESTFADTPESGLTDHDLEKLYFGKGKNQDAPEFMPSEQYHRQVHGNEASQAARVLAKVRAENPDKNVRFITAHQYATEKGWSNAQLRAATNGRPENYVMVKADGIKRDGLQARDIDAIKLDTHKYPDSDSRIEVDSWDGGAIDGHKLMNMFASQDKLPFIDSDNLSPFHRMARRFTEALGAVSDHLGEIVHVPDDVVVARRNGKPLTWGEVKERAKIGDVTDADKARSKLFKDREAAVKADDFSAINRIDSELAQMVESEPGNRTTNDLLRTISRMEQLVEMNKEIIEDLGDVEPHLMTTREAKRLAYAQESTPSMEKAIASLEEAIVSRKEKSTFDEFKSTDEAGLGKEGGTGGRNSQKLRDLEGRMVDVEKIIASAESDVPGAIAKLDTMMTDMRKNVKGTAGQPLAGLRIRYKELNDIKKALAAGDLTAAKGLRDKLAMDIDAETQVVSRNTRRAGRTGEFARGEEDFAPTGFSEAPLDRNIHWAEKEYGDTLGDRFKRSMDNDADGNPLHAKNFDSPARQQFVGDEVFDPHKVPREMVDAVATKVNKFETNATAPGKAVGAKGRTLVDNFYKMSRADQTELVSIVREPKASARAATINELHAKYKFADSAPREFGAEATLVRDSRTLKTLNDIIHKMGRSMSSSELMTKYIKMRREHDLANRPLDSFNRALANELGRDINPKIFEPLNELYRVQKIAGPSPKKLNAFTSKVLGEGDLAPVLKSIKSSNDAVAIRRAVDSLVDHMDNPRARQVLDAANERITKLIEGPDGENIAYNMQRTGAKDMDPAARASVEQYIKDVLGKSVDVEIARMFHSGDFTARTKLKKGLIRVSATALDPLGVAHHESMHAFLSQIRDAKMGKELAPLYKAADTPYVRKVLGELFADDNGVLGQMRDAEERVAYMYQAWMAGKLPKLAAEPTTILGKLKQMIHNVLGTWTNDQRALAMMEYFSTGEYRTEAKNAGAVRTNLLRGTNDRVNTVKELAKPLLKLSNEVFMTGAGRMRATNIPAIIAIADKVYSPLQGEHGDPGYFPAARAKTGQIMNNLSERLAKYSKEHIDEALVALQKGATAASPEARLAAREIKATLQSTRDYMVTNRVQVGDLGPDYFPRSWDVGTILSNEQAFRAMLNKYKASGEFKGSVDRVIATLAGGEGAEMQHEVLRPGMQHTKTRILGFIKGEDAEPFLNKDLYHTVNSYVAQAARRAEWSRRFNDDSSELHSMVAEAQKEGATSQDIETAYEFLKSVDGTLGDNLNPHYRRAFGNMIVYQNIRLLPLMIFSSLIDPGGIMVRGGTIKDSFKALKRGFTEIGKPFKDKPTNDEWTKLSAQMGVIESAVLMKALGTSYSQGMTSNFGRKVNDTFFKYNGMAQFNTSMRVGATEAAVGFLARHADGTASPHSKRWLAELGFKAGEIEVVDGRPLLTVDDFKKAGYEASAAQREADRMSLAINKWVDGAILRPNAAHKPMWMSDPTFALFAHLKQFVYSFQETILKRTINEARYGNVAPMYALAAYVPFMIAADVMKGMLTSGGGVPNNRESWDVTDYAAHGVQRAGLLGVGQIGVDVAKGLQRGGFTDVVGSVSGPAIEQMLEAVSVAAGPRRFSSFAMDALPANQLLDAAGEAVSSGPIER